MPSVAATPMASLPLCSDSSVIASSARLVSPGAAVLPASGVADAAALPASSGSTSGTGGMSCSGWSSGMLVMFCLCLVDAWGYGN